VHHNFVQRWNEASERERPDGHWPEGRDAGALAFPTRLSPPAGDVPVQITRTVSEGRYGDGTPTPDGKPFVIREGEFSIFEQYLAAIDAAKRSIYLEDQAIGSPRIVGHLKAALERGVEVVFLVPGECHPEYHRARRIPALKPFFDLVASLDRYPGFSLVAIAATAGPGDYREIYVHAKVALVDDAWATIGSTNTADRSFQRDTELNASIWHGDVVGRLRRDLFQEHLGLDTKVLDDVGALRRFHEQARDNAWRRAGWRAPRGPRLPARCGALRPGRARAVHVAAGFAGACEQCPLRERSAGEQRGRNPVGFFPRGISLASDGFRRWGAMG